MPKLILNVSLKQITLYNYFSINQNHYAKDETTSAKKKKPINLKNKQTVLKARIH